jgi:trehalose 6-phosphate synthase/phosphatase
VSRLLIVSNRLPVKLRRARRGASLIPSPGGLTTGLAGPHAASDGLWIGWPGELEGLSPEVREDVARQLRERRFVSVELSPELIERYYEGYANGVLWPTFHYVPGQAPLEANEWGAYEEANQRFADAVAEHHRPGDLVWVHDYQLMRVPALLRQRIPDARIGFFLHIPFPSSEMFRTLPERERLLEGVLGADLVGFHTASYLRHFGTSLLRLLGVTTEVSWVRWQSRDVRLGVFPMGIDAGGFAQDAARPEVEAEVRKLRGDGSTQLLLGVDRLDYTKGIPRRLLAFERLLERHPELRGRVRLIQVGVPSREQVRGYESFRRQMDELIGRIHGAFATPQWVPVHWLYRALDRGELLALYRSADVMLVTPVRDGMNLVAKEFVACRADEGGVLVLSEFAGAAAELAEALHVNPFDVEGTAQVIYRALRMSDDECRSRMRGLRRRVFGTDVHRWVRRFIDALRACEPSEAARSEAPSPPRALADLKARLRAAPSLVLLLDYDGTLVPFASAPELARADAELLDLLAALSKRPGTAVHVVSGRRRETLEHWLGDLPIGLHAEHGYWSRAPDASRWTHAPIETAEWRPQVLVILEEFAASTPGSLVEEKTVGVTWHYRSADPEFGARQARELRLHLTDLLANAPVEILTGAKVIEVRPYGVNKGLVVPEALTAAPAGSLAAAFGDDRTDEDMFAALPDGSVAIHVGPSASRAEWRLATWEDARAFLRSLLEPSG